MEPALRSDIEFLSLKRVTFLPTLYYRTTQYVIVVLYYNSTTGGVSITGLRTTYSTGSCRYVRNYRTWYGSVERRTPYTACMREPFYFAVRELRSTSYVLI